MKAGLSYVLTTAFDPNTPQDVQLVTTTTLNMIQTPVPQAAP
jgi:hypothetical protein